MEKLIKPVEYAHQLGISRQAVYAKIKRGILQSKNVDGKLYIVVDTQSQTEETMQEGERSLGGQSAGESLHGKKGGSTQIDYETLLQAKEETISVLKETVKDLKESNSQMSSTLRGEIDLLKDAFYEMRTLYVAQIERIQKSPAAGSSPRAIDVVAVDKKKEKGEKWISLKKFFSKHHIGKRKEQERLARKIKKLYKKGDARFAVDDTGAIKVKKAESLEDILK